MAIPYEKLTVALVSDLHPRTQDVLMRRFGLRAEEAETLEAIGQSHGITRERVRQIVEDGLVQVKEAAARKKEREKLEEIYDQLGAILGRSGYLKRQDLLVREAGAPEAANFIIFLLHLGDKFHRHKETEYAHPFWTNKEEFVEISPRLLDALCAYLRERGEVLEFEHLVQAHSSHEDRKLSPRTLASLLEVSKLIGRTYDGKWGLLEWPEVYPRGMRDKAYVALRDVGKPLHFTEVAKRIEQLQGALDEQLGNWRKRTVLPQTVHNELIKDSRFVLVGRGTYALGDWGYRPGTVKDVIMSILRESGQALPKKEIIEKTLSQRQVRESTILLALQDKTCFAREGDGYICIGE